MIEPWSKFYWSDYDADEGLRICTLAAQGLWMRMLCLMARATPKGELRIAGEPCSVSDLSRAVGESDATVAELLDELRRRGVYSVTRAGVIFSRRLRKDAEISRKRAESGRKGGRASLGKQTENEICLSKNEANKEAKPKPQKPEARSQIRERDKSLPLGAGTGPPMDKSGNPYAFAGETIRLNHADMDAWRAQFHAIPDLSAELAGIDAWFRGQPPEKRRTWFNAVPGMLAKKHQESLERRGSSGGASHPFDDPIAGRYMRRAAAEAAAGGGK